jgi:hypothetical protein
MSGARVAATISGQKRGASASPMTRFQSVPTAQKAS